MPTDEIIMAPRVDAENDLKGRLLAAAESFFHRDVTPGTLAELRDAMIQVFAAFCTEQNLHDLAKVFAGEMTVHVDEHGTVDVRMPAWVLGMLAEGD